MELAAGIDLQLLEDLGQVVLHGSGTDEHAGADLGIGEPFSGQAGDLRTVSPVASNSRRARSAKPAPPSPSRSAVRTRSPRARPCGSSMWAIRPRPRRPTSRSSTGRTPTSLAR